MKIKAIATICKRSGSFILFNGPEETPIQWLSDGSAIYPLLNMPTLTEQNIFTVFGISEKQQEKIYFSEKNLPLDINFNDAAACENFLNPAAVEIVYAGRVVRPLITSQGLIFIDTKYLAPLLDYNKIELYERVDNTGRLYIVAKEGLMMVAVILPYDVVDESFTETLRELTQNCEYALTVKNGKESED